MKPIAEHERRVVNINDEGAFTPTEGEEGTDFIQLNPDAKRFVGFYMYRMAPGSRSTPHRHGGAEEFVVLEGEVIDNDGATYRQGDVVWLAPGTEHNSYAPNGALVAVFSEKEEEPPS